MLFVPLETCLLKELIVFKQVIFYEDYNTPLNYSVAIFMGSPDLH